MSGYEIYVGYHDPPLTDGASPLVGDDFEWPASVAVQWENKETSRCVAALMPNASYALERFLAGANGRKETAILVTRVGIGISPVVADDTRINAAMEPSDIRTHIAEGLTSADKDLAIRLQQDEDATWYRLSVASHVGLGSLHPILVDDLGQPVAGVWIDTDDDLRWYLLPDSIEWQQVVDWLIGRAIPAYVPTAVYRARPMEAVGDQFLTPAELAAKEGLTELERETEKQRTALEAELVTAAALAGAVRNPLLFGQGDDLKKTVQGVLEEAGFNIEDLDETFEDTRSSDLLASIDGMYWLIEVTASRKAPKQQEWSNLKSHAVLWPALRDEPLAGSVLIVNNHHGLPPGDRPRLYENDRFLQVIDGPIIATLALYRWWRDSDFPAIRDAITGSPSQYA